MQNELPPPLAPIPPLLQSKRPRRHAITLKLLFIAALVLLLQAPLHLVNALQEERRAEHGNASGSVAVREKVVARPASPAGGDTFEPYRIVDRALKHSVLVLALVFAAFFFLRRWPS